MMSSTKNYPALQCRSHLVFTTQCYAERSYCLSSLVIRVTPHYI